MTYREQLYDNLNNNFVGNVVIMDPPLVRNRNEDSLKRLIEEGDWHSAFRRFITHPWEISEQDGNDTGHNSLHSVVLRCTNDKEAQKLIHQMLSSDSQFIEAAVATPCHEGGWTVLHLCCRNIEVPDEILLKVAKISPSAIAVQDEEGDTPIHTAFRYGASDEILRYLIETGYRDYNMFSSTSIFAKAEYEGGDLPLHSAISHNASPEIVSLLLDAYPPSISAINSSHFHSPLHIAVECGRYDIVDVITRSHAAMGCVSQLLSMRSRQGRNVLNLLWEKFQAEDDDDADEIWECIINLLLDAQKDPQTIFSSFLSIFTPSQVLNCAIALGPVICPVEFVAKFISIHPHLLKQKDSQGLLPLHQAILHYPHPPQISTSSYFRTDKPMKSVSFHEQQKHIDQSSPSASIRTDPQPNSIIDQNEKDLVEVSSQDKKGSTFYAQEAIIIDHHEDDISIISSSDDALSTSTKSSPDSFINLFLRCFTEGAKLQDKDGNYPLHLAIEANIPWGNGLEEIFHAYPDIIHIPNENLLLPFMMATSLDCTYHLLRQSPSLFTNQFQVNTEKTQQDVTCTKTKSLSVTQHNVDSSTSCSPLRSLKRDRVDRNKSNTGNKRNKYD